MFAMLSVFRKEMTDHLRDRRSIVLSMIYPLLGSLFLGMMFHFIGAGIGTRAHDQAPLKVPIVNPDGAPDLVRFLEGRGATIQRVSADPRSGPHAENILRDIGSVAASAHGGAR